MDEWLSGHVHWSTDEWLSGHVHWEWYIQNYLQWKNHATISRYENLFRTTELNCKLHLYVLTNI
jgi:hypothetical protein